MTFLYKTRTDYAHKIGVQLVAYPFWLAPATMILASFSFLKPCSQMRRAKFFVLTNNVNW